MDTPRDTIHARIERRLQQVSQVIAQSESTYHFPYSSSLTSPLLILLILPCFLIDLPSMDTSRDTMHARIERPLQQVSQVSAQSESTYHFPYSSSLTPPSPPLPLHSHTYHSHSQSHSFLSMDLAIEELQFLSVAGIVRESVRIPGQSHRIFGLITLTLITPLSLSILTHTLFTHPILRRLEASHSAADLAALIGTQFLYLTFLFLFSLLSTAAVVLSVASLYSSSKPPSSFSSLISSALPRAFPRLARTFLFVSLLMLLYNLLFLALFFLLALAYDESYRSSTSIVAAFVVLAMVYFALHVYISAWWHLGSVVSVLEPVCGWGAMRRSRELLRGKAGAAAAMVSVYLVGCGVISGVFGVVVVRGMGVGVVGRVLVGGVLVGVLVVVNLVGLLVQSVFYYVCKSYHHEVIDKSALYEHLGGYLGEYVPLKSSVQMQSFDDSH